MTQRRWCDPRVLVCFALVVLVVAVGVAWVGQRAQPDPPSTTSAEAGFARDMAVHHAQAVDLAQTEQTRTDDEELRVLASDIVLTQQAQIGQLRGWLDQWGLAPTSTEPPMGWMGDDPSAAEMEGMEHPASAQMPGMATPAELEAWRTAPASERDAMFLELMIRHHQGGVQMAQAIVDRTDRPEVRRFAEAVINSQTSEIQTLTTMLEERST